MSKRKMYPVNLILEGRRCAVVGGGHVALRRVRSLVEAGASVKVIAPEAVDMIKDLNSSGMIKWINRPVSATEIVGEFLVIAATDSEEVNRSVAWAAKATGALVNMAAPPLELSDFTVPGRVEHGKLIMTVSTGGTCPELSRFISRDLADNFAEVYGAWLDRLIPIREYAKEHLSSSAVREFFWRTVLDDAVMNLVREKKFDKAEAMVKNAINRFRAES